MADEESKQRRDEDGEIPLERDEPGRPPAGGSRDRDEPSPDKAKETDPFSLEDPVEPAEPRPTRTGSAPKRTPPPDDFNHCPNCGAPMPDSHTLVCLRCGYDLKTLQVRKTKLEKPAEEDEDEAEVPAVCVPGRGDHWLPLAMAAVCGLLLIIGYLAGTPGLFPAFAPEVPGEAVPVADRFVGVLRFLVLITLWTGAGLVGLFLLAQSIQRPVGDLKLAVVRVLGMVVTVRLVSFMHLPGPRWVEWMTEALLQIAAFIVLGMLLFALKPRNAAVMGGFAVIALIVLWLFARLMVWSIEGSV